MKLQGVCLHHDQGALGAVGNEAAFRRQIKIMKDMGINAIRTSHNAASPVFIRLCDEMGIMVFEESFDSWWMGKNDSDYGKQFFETVCTYPGIESGITWAQYDLQQIVKKDRNSPSIIMWSIGNECTETTYEEAIAFAPDIVNWVKDVDEDHPVSMGENKYKLDWSNPTIMKQVDDVLDLVGLNYGEAYYDSLHKEKPNWKIFGSETTSTVSSRGYYAAPWISGDHAVDNVDGNLAEDAVSGKQLSDYDNRTARFGRNVTEALTFDRDRQFIAGQFVWTGFDYLGEAGPWPSRGFTTGMIDLAGNIKPNGYFRRALWLDSPTVYIGTYKSDKAKKISTNAPSVWNYESGEMIRVVAYTNCEEAALYLNGKEIGDRKPYNDETAVIYWDIPYTAGHLEVVGYKEDKPVAKAALRSSGLPYAVKASLDKKENIKAKDCLHLQIQIEDENGIPVALADNQVTCKIEGPAKLLGLESGDNNVADNYRDNKQRCKNGKLLGYIQATGKGKVYINLTSPLLQSSTIEFDVE